MFYNIVTLHLFHKTDYLSLSGNFFFGNLALKIWGLIFGPRIFFGGLLEALGVFWGFDFCPHLIIPVNPEYPPGLE